ncbi:MAG: branched-chain-amino-acid transaminase [Spirochaetaceae bacterium]|jgi:branched-chain amino acid aminotransferase|nr:branched-chain-amino-acid transaminase [Spirochaetaceae bacterium]
MASVWMDGRFYEKDQACVPVYDHGLLYGDGIFEGISVYNGRIFKLKEHLQRLYKSAQFLMLNIPYEIEQLADLVLETVHKEGLDRGYVRLLVTRGTGDLGLDPAKCKESRVIIIADTITLYPREYYEQGISLVTVATRRNQFDNLDPRIKSLNYLNNILAKMEAKQAGCMEALMLNPQGYVTECSADNIFWYDNGSLYTPAVHLGILEGITRNCIIEIAQNMGITLYQGSYGRYDLYNAKEIFITGSGAELMPVVSLDGRIIGDGSVGTIYKTLNSAFQEMV